MYILTILLVFFIVIAIAILTIALIALTLIPIKAFFTFNLKEQVDFNLTIEWSKPVFRCVLGKSDHIIFVAVYLFNTRILNKTVTKNYRNFLNNIKFLKSLDPKYLKLDASYGFVDPSITGMICGVTSLITQSAKISVINNNANFNSDYDYAEIEAFGIFDSIPTILKVLNSRKKGLASPIIQGVK
jgi:hypothetical protein